MLEKKFKKAARRSALRSTAYGLPNYCRSRRLFHKLLWLTFIVLAAIGSFWYITKSVLDYLDFDVVTVIRSMHEQPAQFPTVTFCSYTNNYFDDKNLSQVIEKFSFVQNENMMYNLGNYFESFYTYTYGTCFRFNSGKNLTNHSVPILISTIGGQDDAFALSVIAPGGLALWIHNESSPPKIIYYNIHNGNRILASNQFYTQIIIDRMAESRLGIPYNDCYKNESEFRLNQTIINYIKSTGETYSYQNCLEYCFDLAFIKNNPCNCSNATIGNVWELCWQTVEQSIHSSCTWNFKQDFYHKSIIQECSQYCPIECNSYEFQKEISSVSEFNTNVTRLKMFYRTLKYTLVKEKNKYPLEDLISNIGGILGLFVGISFVNLAELIELVAELFFVFFENLKVNTVN